MNYSEYSLNPSKLLLHHPRHGQALEHLTREQLEAVHFFALPNTSALYAEYDHLVETIKANGTDVLFLQAVLGDDQAYKTEAAANPNLMFMRDSSVTLPWAPQSFIPSRFKLASRRRETEIVSGALQKLRLQPLIKLSEDEYLEGGDVLPVMHEGKRTLIIGFGERTSQAAALKIARTLIPAHIDEIIGLRHDWGYLHLDTGFSILSGNTILAARGIFNDGFRIDGTKKIESIDPIAYAESEGFKIVRCEPSDAIEREGCNVVHIGNGIYLAFHLPAGLRETLEQTAGVKILEIGGEEIVKAAGGVHCLTRPLYA